MPKGPSRAHREEKRKPYMHPGKEKAAKEPGAFQIERGGFVRNANNPTDMGRARAHLKAGGTPTMSQLGAEGVSLPEDARRKRKLKKQQGRP